jgi:hypothetical protein
MGNAVSVQNGPLTSECAKALMGELLWSEIEFDPMQTRSRAELAALVAKHIAKHSVGLTKDSGPDPGKEMPKVEPNPKKEPPVVAQAAPARSSSTDASQTLTLPSVERDKALLMELFRCNNGREWVNSENWCEDTALSTWAGVTTEGTAWIDGNVSALDFLGQGLTGEHSSLQK